MKKHIDSTNIQQRIVLLGTDHQQDKLITSYTHTWKLSFIVIAKGVASIYKINITNIKPFMVQLLCSKIYTKTKISTHFFVDFKENKMGSLRAAF